MSVAGTITQLSVAGAITQKGVAGTLAEAGYTPDPPVFVSAVVEDADPDAIVITFGEALDETSVPATTDFSTSGITGSPSITNVSISTTDVTLTLSGNVAFGDTVLVSYVKPGSNPLQDADGDDVDSFTNESVTNNIEGLPQTSLWGNYKADGAGNFTLDGTDIDSWLDLTDNDNDIPKASDATRPSFDSGNSRVDFDVTNVERLDFQSWPAQPFTIYMVIEPKQIGLTQFIIRDGSPLSYLGLWSNNQFRLYAGSFVITDDTLDSAEKILLVAVVDGASSFLKFKSFTKSGDAGSADPDDPTLGWSFSSPDMYAYEIVVYSVAHDSDERAVVEAFLNSQHGL